MPGVWLDRGELQKLIDISVAQAEKNSGRNAQQIAQPIPRPSEPVEPVPYGYPERRDEEKRYEERKYDHHNGHGYGYGYGKPKSVSLG